MNGVVEGDKAKELQEKSHFFVASGDNCEVMRPTRKGNNSKLNVSNIIECVYIHVYAFVVVVVVCIICIIYLKMHDFAEIIIAIIIY